MDMKEIFENGCFTPEWADADELEAVPAPQRKDLNELLDELAAIKDNIENLRAKSWYLGRLRQFHEHGLSET